jgi:carbon-monoxide dehydrogenase small subunit
MRPAGAPAALEICLHVNGLEQRLAVPFHRRLLDLLRDDLRLTGTKEGCSVGVCGACAVLMDGKLVSSCLILAVMADGSRITTVEGLASEERLHPVQQAFIDAGGFQCGICTPGQVIAAKALLDVNPEPSDEEIRDWMLGNLCRCTGYYKIIESVRQAATALRVAGGGGKG